MYVVLRCKRKKKKIRLNKEMKKENKKSVRSTIKFNVNYYAQRLRESIQIWYLRIIFFFFHQGWFNGSSLFHPSLLVISNNNFAKLKTSKPIFFLLRLAIKWDENETFGIIIEWMDTILTVTKLYRRFWLNVCNL